MSHHNNFTALRWFASVWFFMDIRSFFWDCQSLHFWVGLRWGRSVFTFFLRLAGTW